MQVQRRLLTVKSPVKAVRVLAKGCYPDLAGDCNGFVWMVAFIVIKLIIENVPPDLNTNFQQNRIACQLTTNRLETGQLPQVLTRICCKAVSVYEFSTS